MKTILSILNGSGVNKNNYYTPVAALFNGFKDNAKFGLPSSIEHNIHRLFGWSKPIALITNKENILLAGLINVPENKNDSSFVENNFRFFENERHSKCFTPFAKNLTEKLKKYLTGDAKEIYINCPVFEDKNIFKRVFGESLLTEDKDGLVYLKDLKSKFRYLGQGVFEKEGFAIFTHRYFRRSLSLHNSANSPFLDLFINLPEELNGRIALDYDILGDANYFKPVLELNYWWGPKFSEDIGEIEYGVTRHDTDDNALFFNGISRTEFWWHTLNGERVFECEEVCDLDLPSFGISSSEFGCRYVHSISSEKNDHFIHCDGAIRSYDEYKMCERLDNDISKAGKNTDYTKIWRIDGKINISLWKEILNHYYRDNHLIGEYFGGKKDEIIEERKDSHLLSNNQVFNFEKFVPCNMTNSDPLSVSVSLLFDEFQKRITDIEVFPLNYYEFDNIKQSYIEADFIEIIKIFKRNKLDYNFLSDFKYIVFEDLVWNFPLIILSGSNSINLANQITGFIKDLLEYYQGRGDDRLLSYHFGIRENDKIICFSFAGHIDQILRFLNTELSKLPLEPDIPIWLENIVNWNLSFRGGKTFSKELINEDGLLMFEKKFLKPDMYEFYNKNTNRHFNLLIDENDKEIIEKLKNNEITFALAFELIRSECSKCKKQYIKCKCSKHLDSNVGQIMQEAPLIGLFWTTRTALKENYKITYP